MVLIGFLLWFGFDVGACVFVGWVGCYNMCFVVGLILGLFRFGFWVWVGVVDFDCVFLFWFGLICLVCGFDLICLGLGGGFVVWVSLFWGVSLALLVFLFWFELLLVCRFGVVLLVYCECVVVCLLLFCLWWFVWVVVVVVGLGVLGLFVGGLV